MSVHAPAQSPGARIAAMPATALRRVRAIRREDLFAALRAHSLEALGLFAVFSVAIGVRLWRLGTVPRILAGDETDTIQNAFQINAGTGPGIFELDWSQSPALGIYPLAWLIRIFGDSVTDVRLYVVIFSLMTIALLYVLARQNLAVIPSLAGALLLATNVWYLNFSRTLWYTTNSAFFAVGGCLAITMALKSDGKARWFWWGATTFFVTGGVYGYSSGRFVSISVAVCVLLAVLLRRAPARQSIAALAGVAIISAVLFAPMAKHIIDNYDGFKRRQDTVSVFSVPDQSVPPGPNGEIQYLNGWKLAYDNIPRFVRGAIFNEGKQVQRGPYNLRYHPFQRAPLDLVLTVIFLAGIAVAVVRWRETYTWFPFVIPAAIANIFSTDTPDFARTIVFAPFYFLFIAIAFDQVLRQPTHRLARGGVAAAVLVFAVFVAQSEIRKYFDWQSELSTQITRMPGVDYCEWSGFVTLTHEAIDDGASRGEPRTIDLERFLQYREDVQCSEVVRMWGGYD